MPKGINFIYNPFFLIGALIALAFIGWLFYAVKDPVKNGLKTTVFAFIAIFAMAFAREALRGGYLSKFGYSILTYKVNYSVGSTLLFFITFVMGLVVVSYLLLLAFYSGRSPDEKSPLRLSNLDGLAKIATVLPVLWFIVVVALGIVISLKNKALF